MLAVNRGKPFETKLKEDMLKLPGMSINRIYDNLSGNKGIVNVSDFIAYKYPIIVYAEAKSHHGNTWPLYVQDKYTKKQKPFNQYNKLLEKKGIKGVRAGVILWFEDHDKVLWIPISEIEKMFNEGERSVNIKMLDDNKYAIVELPSIKKRVFMDTDYSQLFEED